MSLPWQLALPILVAVGAKACGNCSDRAMLVALQSQEQDAEDEELLAINVNGKRKAPTQASQSPLAASASAGGSEEAEPVAYKRSRKT